MTLSFETVGINATELLLLPQLDALKVLTDIAAFGFKHVRVELPPQLIMPKKGTWSWAAADFVVATAQANGLTVLPVLGVHMPSWKWSKDVDFREFCRRVHERYALPAYEIWNESNTAGFSENNWASGNFLTALLKAAQAGFNDVSLPPPLIVSGGMAAAITHTGVALAWPPIFHNDSPEDYLTLVMAGGAPFHVTGYHPYSLKDDFSTYEKPSATQKFIAKSAKLVELTGRTVWATEWGFHLNPLTATQIADYLTIQLPLVDQDCARQYLFCWRDYAAHGTNYGLVDARNVPRQPVYDTVMAILS